VLGAVAGVNNATVTTNVGIGTNNPAARLHVGGDAAVTGTLGIGTTSPIEKLEVAGNGRFTGNLTAVGNVFGASLYTSTLGNDGTVAVCLNTSSERLSMCSSSLRYKTNVSNFTAGLDLINRLRPIAFDWKSSGTHDIGFGAEDVEKIDPRFVIYNDKGEVEGVKYDRISVVLVNAVKEQQAEIAELRRQLDEQKALTRDLVRSMCEQTPGAAVCKK
jgi:hypothetical protein